MMGRKAPALQAFVLGVCAAALLWAQPAQALDAPKWVAAMYMEAQTQVGLRWQPVPGATGYKVLRSTTAGKGYAEVAAPAQPQHFDAEGLTPGVTYYYVLQAVAGAETSPNSLERPVVVTQAAKSVPPSLTNVEMDQNAEGIRVTWQAVGGTVAYNLYRRESFKPAGKEDLIGSVPTADPYMDKTNLKKGIEYIYSVTALDSAFNETAKSTTLSAKFTPKEEKKVVARTEDKVIENWKVKFLGEVGFEPEEGVVLQGQANIGRAILCDDELFVYFASGASAQIQVFDEKGGFLRRLIAGGPGMFPISMTYFVCGYNDSDLLGLSNQTRSVLRVSRKDGTVVDSFPWDNGVDPKNPLDAMMVQAGRVTWRDDEVFLSDFNNNVIRVFDLKGKLLRRIGEGYGTAPNKFALPSDIFFTKDGKMVVLEVANARVQVFGPDEKSLLFFGEEGKRVGQFARASGMTWDPVKSRLYVSDFLNSVVHVFKIDGSVVGVIKMPDPEKERRFNSPSGVFYGENGILYEIDYGIQKVLFLQDVN